MDELVGRWSVVGQLSPRLCLSVSLLAACSEPDWLPPPTDATATCIYERDVGLIPRSTLYFDAQNRVMRADGFASDDDGDLYRASYSFDYDDQGRLVGAHGPYGDVGLFYSEQQIVRTFYASNYEYSYDLVDGHVVAWQGPLLLPEARRIHALFEYDDAGRITRRQDSAPVEGQIVHRDTRYIFDGQGRVTTIERDGRASTIAYTDFPQQLIVNLETSDDTFLTQRWTIDYDEEHRIVKIATDDQGGPGIPYVFTYSDGAWTETRDGEGTGRYTLTATGQCAPPSLTLAPPPPQPNHWFATIVEPHYLDHFLFEDVGL